MKQYFLLRRFVFSPPRLFLHSPQSHTTGGVDLPVFLLTADHRRACQPAIIPWLVLCWRSSGAVRFPTDVRPTSKRRRRSSATRPATSLQTTTSTTEHASLVLYTPCYTVARMACSAQSMTIESYPDSAVSSSATPNEETSLLRDRRRRHSFDNARKSSCDYDGDAVYLRVSLNWSNPGISFGKKKKVNHSDHWRRLSSSSQNWSVGCTGSRSTGNRIWCRSMLACAEDMRRSRP